MDKFEYKQFDISPKYNARTLIDGLNRLGWEGWELVLKIRHIEVRDNFSFTGIFKRKKQ